METIKVNFDNITGTIKAMHSVNNGPAGSRGRSNFDLYADAHIPYARLHDSSLCSAYGGHHIVDVLKIFTNFDADPTDPANYDFTLTDLYLKNIIDAGTKPFYRLGSSIEHWAKKYEIMPPKDFKKWAVICEHIIKHYTEGWADGFNYDIEYWEIWNEPDTGYKENNSPTWGGTMDEFFEFFKICLFHLKGKFPHLKIGGPALCSVTDSIDIFEDMMKYLTEGERAPLDFFSWHMYGSSPKEFERKIKVVDDMLNKYGYGDAESILNEWNYVKDWANLLESYNIIKGLKGSAYIASAMCECQRCGLDHLMYYDARPTPWNGMFDSPSFNAFKGYYSFPMFNKLYELKNEVECKSLSDMVYACAAKDGNEAAIMLSYFNEEDETAPCEVGIDISGFTGENGVKVTYRILDNERDNEIFREEYFMGDRVIPRIKIDNYSTVLIGLEKA